MKDLTKLKSNVYSSTSVGAVSRNMINRQMFHHYRRVLSARKVVDCSPPFAYRHPQSARRETRPGPEEGDSKKRCIVAEMLKLSCSGGRRARSELDVRSPSSPVYATPRRDKKCGCPDGNDRSGAKAPQSSDLRGTSFTRPGQLFRPAVLRREAESKVRGLRVYHPPRKRPSQHDKDAQRAEAPVTSGESSARSTATGSREAWDELPSVGACFCGAAKSKVSSCDSAYNGGGTSSAPESGGSSPARRQTVPRDSSYSRFDETEKRKDASVQTESVDGDEKRTVPDERRKWSFTELYLYPDPFDDDLLLEECVREMGGLDLSAEDPYPWSEVPSLSGELFV